MTLSCRAQAFSVDNLLRPSSATFTASSSTKTSIPPSTTSINELPSKLDLEKLVFRNRKCTQNNDVISRRDWSHEDDLPKNVRSINPFSNKNIKQDPSIYTHQDEFTLNRRIQPHLEDIAKPSRTGHKRGGTNSENVDDQDIKLYSFLYPGSTKPPEEKASLDASRPGKKVRSSKQSAVSTSCFCHGEMLFCHHPGMASIVDSNGSENCIIAELCHADLWTSFHRLGTEMIITKTGRRMFPALKLRITGLYPDKQYIVRLEFVQPDNRKYRYIYHSSRWMVSGSGDSLTTQQSHRAADGPVSGQAICSQIVSFERLKLTNTDPCKTGQVSLVSMQKFQPQIVIQEVGNMADSDVSETEHYVIMFPQTSFMAVTAYQNQQITTLKIASNPFAKGFRESGKARIPYESFMTTIPNFLSRDAAMDYIPGVVRSSAWPHAQFFPREYNLGLDKRCQDRRSTVDHYKVVPEKILKMESDISVANLCRSDMTTTTTAPSNPALYAALQKPVTIPLPTRHIQTHDYHLYQQQQRHYHQQLLASATPRTLQPLMQYLPYISEQQKIISSPEVEIQNAEDLYHNSPPPAHNPTRATPIHPLKQQPIISEIPSKISDSSLSNHLKGRTTDISTDFLTRRFENNDAYLIQDSHLLARASHSLAEHKYTNGRSRSSHSSSSVFNLMLPPRCMTEPSKMAAGETCRCVDCRYQSIPSCVM